MSFSLGAIEHSVRAFADGGAFQPLWSAVMDATEVIDSAPDISDRERDWFDRLYELVYMGAEDPVDAQSRANGVLGAAELRQRIRELAPSVG
jgi:hypothetical protein